MSFLLLTAAAASCDGLDCAACTGNQEAGMGECVFHDNNCLTAMDAMGVFQEKGQGVIAEMAFKTSECSSGRSAFVRAMVEYRHERSSNCGGQSTCDACIDAQCIFYTGDGGSCKTPSEAMALFTGPNVADFTFATCARSGARSVEGDRKERSARDFAFLSAIARASCDGLSCADCGNANSCVYFSPDSECMTTQEGMEKFYGGDSKYSNMPDWDFDGTCAARSVDDDLIASILARLLPEERSSYIYREDKSGGAAGTGCLKRTADGYPSFTAAKVACNADSECGAIEKPKYPQTGKKYMLCEGSEVKTTAGARVMLRVIV